MQLPWYAWMLERVPEEVEAWAAAQAGPEAWSSCPRGDWLLRAMEIAGAPLESQILAASACARMALPAVPAGDARVADAIAAAEAWARGERGADLMAPMHAAQGGRYTPADSRWRAETAAMYAGTAATKAYDAATMLLEAIVVPENGGATATVAGLAAEALGLLAFARIHEHTTEGSKRAQEDAVAAANRAEERALAEMAEAILRMPLDEPVADLLARQTSVES